MLNKKGRGIILIMTLGMRQYIENLPKIGAGREKGGIIIIQM